MGVLLIDKHTIRKFKFLSKNSILTKLYNFSREIKLKSPKPQHFREFFAHIFLTIFLVKSKLSTAKKSKTAAFSQVFHPKQFDNFSREIKVEFFGQKMKISNSVDKEHHHESRKSWREKKVSLECVALLRLKQGKVIKVRKMMIMCAKKWLFVSYRESNEVWFSRDAFQKTWFKTQ